MSLAQGESSRCTNIARMTQKPFVLLTVNERRWKMKSLRMVARVSLELSPKYYVAHANSATLEARLLIFGELLTHEGAMASQLRALSLRTTRVQRSAPALFFSASSLPQRTCCACPPPLLLLQRRLSHSTPPTTPRAKKKQDSELDKLAPALQAFYQVYGHFAVPHRFQIPNGIAAAVAGERERIQDDANDAVSSVQPHAAIQGDDDATDTLHRWPEELRGLKLDALVIRFCREVKKLKAPRKPACPATLAPPSSAKGKTPPASADEKDELESKALVKAIRKQLRDIGFPVKQVVDVEHGWSKFRWQEGTFEPLRVFKDLYGHLLVPQEFVVPFNDEKWPRCAWGTKFGMKAHYLRIYNLDHRQKSQLNAIGFVWDGHTAQREMWNRLFMPALRRFKELHGHCDVPEDFVIPIRDEDQLGEDQWPNPLGGFVLGAVVHATRLGRYGRNVVESFDELKQLGFLGDKLDMASYQYLYPLFSWYQKKYGHFHITREFVIPESSDDEKPLVPIGRRDLGEMIWESGFFVST